MKVWIARDKSGALYLYNNSAVYKDKPRNIWNTKGRPFEFMALDPNLFPEVKWEDEELTEVEVTIKPIKK